MKLFVEDTNVLTPQGITVVVLILWLVACGVIIGLFEYHDRKQANLFERLELVESTEASHEVARIVYVNCRAKLLSDSKGLACIDETINRVKGARGNEISDFVMRLFLADFGRQSFIDKQSKPASSSQVSGAPL